MTAPLGLRPGAPPPRRIGGEKPILPPDLLRNGARYGVLRMRQEWITDGERFAEIAAAWERLADRHSSPFVRHAWFSAWWSAFGDGRELRVCTIWDEAELVAAFPLCTARVWLEPLANAHTPWFEPLASNEEVLRELIAAVLAASPALLMPRVPDESPALAAIREGSAESRRLGLVQAGASPFVDTRGDVAGYWSRLSGNARRDFRRCRRLLDALPNVDQTILEVPHDLEAELERGFAVEGSGWKSRRGTAILDSPATHTFYREVSAGFARSGKLRLSTLSIGGSTAAFNLNLLDHGKIWGLKGGYDPEYARYAPGLLLLLAEVEQCFALELSSLELLGEESAWKRKLTRDARVSWTVGSFARRPLPLIRYGYRRHLRPTLHRVYSRLLADRGRG